MAINVQQYLKAAGGLSAAAILAAGLVTKWEGKETTVYKDPVGILTSCYGHTGPELKVGQRFTEQQCLDQLAEDLREHEAQLLSQVKVPMNVYQQAAYISFTYNVGIGTVKQSTLLKLLNAGMYKESCAQLSRFVYAQKKKLKGLVNRRADEYEMCMRGFK